MSLNFVDFKKIIKDTSKEISAIIDGSVISDSEAFQKAAKALNALEDKLEKEEFTVGVVGVFNSGKSTFLNAMMGREILSTFILPETAAITKLTHGESESAEVTYWDKNEWVKIKADAEAKRSQDPSVITAVEESEQKLGSTLKNILTTPAHTRQVSLSELADFTAKQGDHSAFVREVELKVDLDFCKDSISIVDTPGLNDPVQLREIITRDYFLPKCDLIIFLVSASQAFTKFDEDFLIDQTKRGQLNKLFLVVNKIDQLNNAKEQEAVVKFAQKSAFTAIDRGLAQVAPDRRDNLRVDSVETFPISASQALMHRCPSEGETPRLSIEESGMNAFEDRLRKFLFEGERAHAIILNFTSLLNQGVFATLQAALGAHQFSTDDLEEIKTKITKQTKDLEYAQRELGYHENDVELRINSINQQISAHRAALVSSVKSRHSDVFKFVMVKVENYLEDHNGFSAAWKFEDWAKSNLPSIVEDAVVSVVKEELDQFGDEFKKVMDNATSAITAMYEQLNDRIAHGAQNVLISNDAFSEIGGALLTTVVEVAIAHIMRTTLPMIIAVIAGEVAATLAGLLAGPVGLVILAGVGIYSIFTGSSKLKDKLRSTMEKELPEPLREVMMTISDTINTEIEEKLKEPMEEILEAFKRPGEQLQANISAEQEALEQLSNDLESGEEALREKLEKLSAENTALESLKSRFKTAMEASK